MHNDDQINTFAYGMSKLANFEVDQNSRFLIEICDNNKFCDKNTGVQCAHSRGYTYAQLIKTENSNTRIYPTQSENVKNNKLVITEFPETIHNLNNYKFYEYNQSYGTDILLPEAYQW